MRSTIPALFGCILLLSASFLAGCLSISTMSRPGQYQKPAHHDAPASNRHNKQNKHDRD
ncbi:MAG: hypothetical protein R8K21_07070 [Mariprofundales bacterium]